MQLQAAVHLDPCQTLLVANLPEQQLPLPMALPRPRLHLSREWESLRGRRRYCRLLWTRKPPHQASGSRYAHLFVTTSDTKPFMCAVAT